MSTAAMSWALQQLLSTPQQQGLLFVIADSADPEGLTRYCDPPYMERHARLTRATMFRCLGEMQDKGLLERRKWYTEKGAVRYEIQLNFARFIDEPIRRRRKPDDPTNSGDDDADTQDEEMNPIPESHPETLDSADHSLTSDGPKSQSCDYHRDDPSLIQESPPTPSGGRSRSKMELEAEGKRDALWNRFVQTYPEIKRMHQRLAREELDALSLDDAEWAVSVVPALAAELAKPKAPPPRNAHLWLRKRMFENFPRQKLDAPPPEGVWIAEGSDADRALRLVRDMAKVVTPFMQLKDGQRGYLHKVPPGEDLLAMLRFADDVTLRWPLWPRGSASFAAWQARVTEWVGKPLPLEGDGIRAPCPFPPSRQGVVYDEPVDSAPLAS